MIKYEITFVGSDGSKWDFTELTGFHHPDTDDKQTLKIFAEAALYVDPRIKRFSIRLRKPVPRAT